MTSPTDRIHRLLANLFAQDARVRIERPGGPGDDEFLYLTRDLGRCRGRTWKALVSLCVKGGTIPCMPVCSIRVAVRGDASAYVCDLDDAEDDAVPRRVAVGARDFLSRIEGLDIPHLSLDARTRDAVDLLRDILVAKADGDGPALDQAMAAARESVVVYRPSLAGRLSSPPEPDEGCVTV